ncbi:hypothetical protein JQ582_03900 [Bradyrhizobium japonicum]|jgi:hypothetical protein|uniref:Uncharacterized protein n=4 Tax=Bradyrhizobium TaxID=374 RepID=A0A0A3XS76_BRAJP|nr:MULTISPECIES: hypothetical protein [Bradyrhizobium]AJA63428.1 hypothetical protein RN69_26200 [Bradyrhizobium japonicum]KGT76124.1 hypothetical protein MA20_30370 [Bradyrhizobium japonicum]MBR0728435.1 hypothetical protein [Bradyrhizobium japonicum]MBR0743053.1 hypothetical protein [Bradyrhizobium japonicum]MBR0760660.1 hypothetical protein [Bradyrhizobium japonicum]
MPPDLMRPDIIVPFVMYCALLLWVGRGLSWTAKLATAAVTLVLIICVLLVERGWR